jgi:hypothetical protein
LDLLDVRFTESQGFDLADIPDATLVRNASGLMDNSVLIAVLGFILCLVATRIEYVRYKGAIGLAQTLFTQSKWNR